METADPRSDMNLLRATIAEDNGILLYKKYDEAEAAAFLNFHPRTLKDMRLQGRIGFVRFGPRKISYLGIHIADFIIGGIKWAKHQNRFTVSENTGSPVGTGRTSSTDTGMITSERSRVAHRSALRTLKTPRTN